MFLRNLILLVTAVALLLGAVNGDDASATATIQGKLLLSGGAPFNTTTRMTLNDGEHATYTQPDGSFIFHSVGPGVHVLDSHSHAHHFATVKIQLLPEAMDSPKCIEYAFAGASKQVVQHPLVLTAIAEYVYFEKRPRFSIFSIFKNPMMLMMIIGSGLMLLMPKMMEGLDDEQKEDMRKQMEMQQDPTKMLSQLFGGGDAEDAQTKSAIKAGGKTARRAKRE